MAYQNSIKVEITTLGGFEQTADDAVLDGQGSAAYGALVEGKKDLLIQTDTGFVFIPFHAVDHAIITVTRSESEDPDDPTCVVEESSDDNGDGSEEP